MGRKNVPARAQPPAEITDPVTVKEAARLRGVTPSAIRDLARRGRIRRARMLEKTVVSRAEVMNLEELPHGLPKLDRERVRVIKRRLANGDGTTEIARDEGVSPPTVSHIKAGRTWRDVQP